MNECLSYVLLPVCLFVDTSFGFGFVFYYTFGLVLDSKNVRSHRAAFGLAR